MKPDSPGTEGPEERGEGVGRGGGCEGPERERESVRGALAGQVRGAVCLQGMPFKAGLQGPHPIPDRR